MALSQSHPEVMGSQPEGLEGWYHEEKEYYSMMDEVGLNQHYHFSYGQTPIVWKWRLQPKIEKSVKYTIKKSTHLWKYFAQQLQNLKSHDVLNN